MSTNQNQSNSDVVPNLVHPDNLIQHINSHYHLTVCRKPKPEHKSKYILNVWDWTPSMESLKGMPLWMMEVLIAYEDVHERRIELLTREVEMWKKLDEICRESIKVRDLKEYCSNHGLTKSGTKEELKSRLVRSIMISHVAQLYNLQD